MAWVVELIEFVELLGLIGFVHLEHKVSGRTKQVFCCEEGGGITE
jgi:hypothetical protein